MLRVSKNTEEHKQNAEEDPAARMRPPKKMSVTKKRSWMISKEKNIVSSNLSSDRIYLLSLRGC